MTCFEKGIERCVNELSGKQIDLAVLQSRSPSCGVNQIYDGNFSGEKWQVVVFLPKN